MFKKISDEAFIEPFLNQVSHDENIRLVLMNGSRVNPEVREDEYQDYDLVLFSDENNYTNPTWMSQFGEILIYQIPDNREFYPQETILVQYTNGHRIDLSLYPCDYRNEIIKRDSLTKIIIDKDHILSQTIKAHDEDYRLKEPTVLDVHDCINEFWWITLYVLKGIKRGEFFYAARHMERHLLVELMKVVAWTIGAQHSWAVNVGKDYKFINRYLKSSETQSLLALHQIGQPETMIVSLKAAMDLFDSWLKRLDAIFPVPTRDYQAVYDFVCEQLEEVTI